MSGVLAKVNELLFRKTSTYAVVVMGGAFFFERSFDLAAETIFEQANKGKLWKDIKDKYEQQQ